MELAAQTWVEDWNHLRKGKNAINRIEIIELRTDPKYGKFIKHEPARARVKVARQKDKIVVEIQDFISPHHHRAASAAGRYPQPEDRRLAGYG